MKPSFRFLAIAWVLSLAAFASPARAQEAAQPSTTTSERFESGGYSAPMMKITTLAGSPGVLFGSEGGWILNHHFVLGGAGYGLMTDAALGGRPISLGYGGVRPGCQRARESAEI